MAETGVIDEFLINIGFTTDEQGQRRYNDTISAIDKGVAFLITSFSGAAFAVASAVEKIADNLSKLYYAAQDLHSLPQSVTALDRTLEDLEGSADRGRAAFKRFSDFMRSDPRHKGYYEEWLGKPFPEGDNVKAFVDLVDAGLKKIQKEKEAGNRALEQHYIKLLESEFHIDAAQFDPKIHTGFGEKFKEKLAELGKEYEENTKRARDLTVALNKLAHTIQDIGIKAAGPLFKPLHDFLEWLSTWIDENQDSVIDFLKEIRNQIVLLGRDLRAEFGGPLKVIRGLLHLVEDGIVALFGDEAKGLKGLHIILAAITSVAIVGALSTLASALTLGFAPFKVLAFVLTGILATLAAINALPGGASFLNWLTGGGIGGVGAPGEIGGPGGGRGGTGGGLGGRGAVGGGEISKPITSAEQLKNRKESWDFLKGKGLSDKAAAAIIGSEQGESAFNPTASGDSGRSKGSFQWDETRRAAIKAATGIDVSTAPHIKQLEAMWWETHHGDAGAQAAMRVAEDPNASMEEVNAAWVRLHERSKYQASDIAKRSGHAKRALADLAGTTPTSKAGPTPPPQVASAPATQVPAATLAPQVPTSQSRAHQGVIDFAKTLAPVARAKAAEVPKPLPLTRVEEKGKKALDEALEVGRRREHHHRAPTGKPLGADRPSPLPQVYDSRSVNHETSIKVIGDSNSVLTLPDMNNAGMLGHLTGNSR